jgi:hypothetical protein
MDILLRVAAWATPYYSEYSKVIEGVTWLGTNSPYIKLACQLLDIEIPDWVDYGLDQAEDFEQQKDAAEHAENLGESLADPDRGVEIGGPQVEEEIAEIKNLQQEQKIERADLARDIENHRDLLTEQYADSPDEMQRQLERFDEAAIEAQKDLAAQQAMDLQKLQEQQQLEQQQLEQQQLERQLEQQLEQLRLEQEQLEQQQLEQGQLEQQQLEQERLEQLRLEQQQLEQRLEQLRLEQERLEQLRLEQERLEQLRLEQMRLAALAALSLGG